MSREYSIEDACRELGCTRKTLGEWIAAEGIEHLPRGKVDKRNRVLSRSLLVSLSKKHKRPLLSDVNKEAAEQGIGSLAAISRELRLLRSEVEHLRQQVAFVREQQLHDRKPDGE